MTKAKRETGILLVQDALDAGMNAHIAKPINMETLKNTLGSCIKR